MSIFSGPRFSITARTRAPPGPISAPFGFTPSVLALTAILVRAPASRAMAMMDTAPETSSGTSRSNSLRTSSGWERDTTISGPLMPRATFTTYTRMRSPWR